MTNANRKRQLAVETAAKEGVRASVPLYVAAAEAFVQEDRPAQGVELLGELLTAKEKKRGLFARVEKNPLGPERLRAAIKYAEISRMASPTEDSLELLEDLSVEFPDAGVIRRAHADALRNAGYAADAIEEYGQCARLEPSEADIPIRLSELNAALGHTDEATELLRHGIALHAAANEYQEVADRAMRFIDLGPDGLDDVFQSYELIPGDVLRKHVPSLDHLGVLVRRDLSRPDDWRTGRERRLVDLYTRVLESDGRNAAARRGINVLGPQYLVEVEARLKAGSAAKAQAAQAAVAAAQAAIAPPRVPEAAPPPAVEPEPQTAELVERSPGELIAEEVVDTPAAAAPAAPPAAPKPAPAQVQTPAPAPAATPPHAKTPAAPVQPAAAPPPAAAQAPTPPVAAQTPAAAAQTPPAAAQTPPTVAQTPAAPTQPPATPAPSVPPPAAPSTPAPQPVQQKPAAAQVQTPPPATVPAAPAQPSAPPQEAAPAKPAAAASAPSRALYAFALRKAQEQFDAGSYEDAAQHCERLLKRGEIAEVLQLYVRCLVKLDRKREAVQAGLRFAEAAAAEDPVKALESLTDMIKQLPDPALILRRSQLLSSLRQVEFAAKPTA